ARSQHRFKGRTDLFGEIEKLTLAPTPPVLLLYGGRRTGKSSTLEHLPTRLPSSLIPLRVDLQGVADASTLFGVAQSFSQFMVEAAARLPRRLTLPAIDAEALRLDPFPALRQWFSQIERTFPDKRFLLCLDEYERLEEVVASTSRAPLNFLRHIMQHRPQWVLLFSGSHTPNELAPYWSDYLINTRSLRVSYLKDSAARDLIIRPIPDFPDIYSPAAVDRILHWTRRQPYLIQLLGSVIVDRLNDPDGRLTMPVTPTDIDTLVPLAIESGIQYFQELWNLP
ncbi:MAG: ATP-binding protein, partial [Pseudanabaenales cyanobacterium]|nr:ATP-binding protein [Pseudanabaenales cyanobacterium]